MSKKCYDIHKVSGYAFETGYSDKDKNGKEKNEKMDGDELIAEILTNHVYGQGDEISRWVCRLLRIGGQ